MSLREGVFWSLWVLPLAGCQTANSYAIPDTLGRHRGQLVVALEGNHIRSTAKEEGALFPERVSKSTGYSVLPTVIGRYGLTDSVEAGIALRSYISLGADVKVQVLRGPLGIALMPGGQVTVGQQMIGLPVLLGVKLGEPAEVVLSPGVAYVHSSAPKNEFRHLVLQHSTPLGRLGAGVRLRVSRSVAVHPEVTAMQALDGSNDRWITLGVGLIGGNL